MSAQPRFGSSTSLTLINLNSWLSSIEAAISDQSLNPVSVKAMFGPAGESIRIIAENLIQHATGVERDLLSKSLQETLLYCTGIDLELDYGEIRTRLLRFLATRGKSAVIEQFLGLCIFNLVWFGIGESFRVTTHKLESFEKDIDEVEQICQRVVGSAWRSYKSEHDEGELGPDAAEKIIRTIEDQLRGHPQGPTPHP